MRNVLVLCVACVCLGCTGSTADPVEPEVTATASTPSTATTATPSAPTTAQPSASADSGSFAAHTPATLTGTVAGKPFEAGGACVVGPSSFAPGYVYIEIYDKTELDAKGRCGTLSKEKGARKIGIVLPWKEGEKVDLATLKPKKNDIPLFVMERINDNKADRKDGGKDLKPTGSAEVVRVAPKDGVGRIKLSMLVGKEKLEGEVDVDVVGDVANP